VSFDLYVKSKNNIEYFFEIKSPQPNKGQCIEILQRILRIHALKNQKRPFVSAYFAMAYNPFGIDKSSYKWSFARNYLPFDETVVLGQEFWEIIGGKFAYEELLNLYRTVGKEKSKFILDALAYGF